MGHDGGVTTDLGGVTTDPAAGCGALHARGGSEPTDQDPGGSAAAARTCASALRTLLSGELACAATPQTATPQTATPRRAADSAGAGAGAGVGAGAAAVPCTPRSPACSPARSACSTGAKPLDSGAPASRSWQASGPRSGMQASGRQGPTPNLSPNPNPSLSRNTNPSPNTITLAGEWL